MLRLVKQIVWLAGFIIGCQSALGFSLIGPIANNQNVYQVPAIGYGVGAFAINGAINVEIAGYAALGPPALLQNLVILAPSDDIGTPKDIGEGYRRNTPVMYYSFDSSFLGFFGQDGATEVDKAMAIYNSLTNVSSYSPDLSEFPDDSRRVNFRAASANLLDIKSVTLGIMTEQLGFWEPTRWVWALHARTHIAGTGLPPCPGAMEYLIDKRNLDINSSDPTNYVYSSYVNNVLYSYFIDEFCTGVIPLADAVEIPVDPLSAPYSAVADFTSLWYAGLTPGGFYTSLTRDDVAGLRYLIRQNNRAFETAGARTTEFITNAAPAAIQTFDLHLFAAQAKTNDAATLATLYPGLLVTSTSNFFGLLITTNITETLVNSPFDPAGSLPSHPVFTTNYSTNFFNFFQHSFGNLVTNSFANRGLVGGLSIVINNSPFAPAGSPQIVVTNLKPAFVPGVFGDFFLLPTNFCGAQILSNLLTQVIATTNPPTVVGVGTTNTSVTFTPGNVDFFTNHFVVYLPVTCPVDPAGTFGGIEKIRFIRRDYDSTFNRPWDPVTNDYTLLELTNSAMVPRHVQRAVPKPDFLFTATDLALDTSFTYSNTVAGATETLTIGISVTGGIGKYDVVRTMTYNQTARPGNSPGPGTIESPLVLPTLIIFNKMGPLYSDSNLLLATNAGFFLNEQTANPFFSLSWGAFDGSTNAPEVFPNNHSITELENLMIGPAVTTPFLPNANVGANYFAQLAAIGGQAPYTWSLAPGSAGLPAGLSISPGGVISGIPSGTPAIYDFTVRVTDSAGVTKDQPFTITLF